MVFLGFTCADMGLARPAGFCLGGDITCKDRKQIFCDLKVYNIIIKRDEGCGKSKSRLDN